MITDSTYNIHCSPTRVICEAKDIDMAYRLAMDEDRLSTNYLQHPNLQQLPSQGINMQVNDGPKVFCDASVCVQQPPNQTQTALGVFILTTPTHSLCTTSFFRLPFHITWNPWTRKHMRCYWGPSYPLR